MRYIYLLILLILTSCGSRKSIVNKENTKTETTTEATTTFSDSSNITIKYDILSESLTVFAKDSLKPFIYNGNAYFNAVLKHEKKKDNTLYTKQNKINYKQVIKVVTKTITITKTKEVVRKESYFKYILILLAIVCFYILYRYRNYII